MFSEMFFVNFFADFVRTLEIFSCPVRRHMPAHFGAPHSAARVAVCSAFRDESRLPEWLDHHKRFGGTLRLYVCVLRSRIPASGTKKKPTWDGRRAFLPGSCI